VPIYEYECSKCCQITEALQKFSEPPLKDCPHCSGRLKRLMSINSFHLKGSGWYVTDYAGKKASNQPSKSSSEGSANKKEKASKPEKSDSSSKSPSES
jgi:putative FmdB family regulatory protein